MSIRNELERSDFLSLYKHTRQMTTSRLARFLAVLVLYWLEHNPQDLDIVFEQICEWLDLGPDHPAVKTAYQLVYVTLNRQKEYDKLVADYAKRWSPQRISMVIRCILRVALSEIFVMNREPALVINEAIELAKLMAEEEGFRFVNGVLDQIYKSKQSTKAHEPEWKP